MKNQPVAIALGSNLGDRLGYLCRAVEQLEILWVGPAVLSSIYETAPWGFIPQPPFLNAVVFAHTPYGPFEILRVLQEIENQLGRVRTFRYGPRAIDLDLIAYGDRVVDHPELQVPHPEMPSREFVLCPFAEVWPDWEHPQLGKTAVELMFMAAAPSNPPENANVAVALPPGTGNR